MGPELRGSQGIEVTRDSTHGASDVRSGRELLERFKGKRVVAVGCGRKVDLEVFKRIIR